MTEFVRVSKWRGEKREADELRARVERMEIEVFSVVASSKNPTGKGSKRSAGWPAALHMTSNNLLNIVSACTELLRDMVPAGPKTSEYLSNIGNAVQRGLLTRQLLAFSHQQVVQPRLLDLNERDCARRGRCCAR